MSLRDKYAIVGTGTSRLGQVPGVSSVGLITEAMRNCVADAQVRKEEIDGIICRGPDDAYAFHQRVAERLGINVGFSTTMDNGGASQILSVALAAMAIDAGLCSVVLCGFGRDTWSRTHRDESTRMRALNVSVSRYEFGGEEFGMFGAPAMHALGARRHMTKYGTTKQQLGAVAVAFREHASRNPYAQMRKSLTMEEYLSARQIVEPFGLFDCSLQSDAAGAILVMSADRAKHYAKHPVLISGFGTYNKSGRLVIDEVEQVMSLTDAFAFPVGTPQSDVDALGKAMEWAMSRPSVVKEALAISLVPKFVTGPVAHKNLLTALRADSVVKPYLLP